MKTYAISIKDGNLTDTGLLKSLLELKDGNYEVYIGTASEIRSSQSNKYFHKLLDIWSKDLGYSPLELKCHVKMQLGLFAMSKNRKTGNEIIVYEESRKWNQEKFNKVTDWILETANQTGCHLQTPDEFYGENT